MDMSMIATPYRHVSDALDEPLIPVEIPDVQALAIDTGGFFSAFVERLVLELASDTIWLQVGGIVASILLAVLIARLVKAATGSFFGDMAESFREGKYGDALRSVVLPTLVAAVLWLIIAGFSNRAMPVDYMRIVGSVLVAVIITRIFAKPRSDPFWKYTITAIAWAVAGLMILRLFTPFVKFIESLKMPFGEDVSLLDIFNAIAIAIALIWAASFLARMVEARLRNTAHMAPSVRGLFSQLVRILMIGAAVVLALNTIGIDLTAFAVFTGALGVGIGFGLQSIFSNFVAGIIIILEKTLKVGDFVDLQDGVRGEVQEINVRSTLIRTNDNIDMLVPNSEFINNRVTNWTLREAKRRLHVPVGVAYGSDKDLVKKALLEAAENVQYTLKSPKSRAPDVWLTNFGDSSLDFELIVWLTDEATKKPGRVHAAYCWEIETQFAKYGISIPFPQRDLHIIKPED